MEGGDEGLEGAGELGGERFEGFAGLDPGEGLAELGAEAIGGEALDPGEDAAEEGPVGAFGAPDGAEGGGAQGVGLADGAEGALSVDELVGEGEAAFEVTGDVATGDGAQVGDGGAVGALEEPEPGTSVGGEGAACGFGVLVPGGVGDF